MTERLERDTLVELQDQYSNVYPLSPTGARGWVRAKRELPKIDPEVYIEWDKNHWRYHGEPDGWTFEHHFRLVTDTLPDIHDDDAPIIPDGANLLKDLNEGQPQMSDILAEAHRQIDSERCPHCGDLHSEETDFINTLMEAQDSALGSEGYMIITITPHYENDLVYYEPQIFMETLTDASRRVIESQAIYIASQLFENFMLSQVQKVTKKRPDEPGR